MTFSEYLAIDRAAEVKHELIDGVAVAMAGGTKAHAQLGAGVTRVLGAVALDLGCSVYNSELRIRTPDDGSAWYPDATVVCGTPESDLEDPDTVLNPVVIVEVLSASTERHDRGPKWRSYQSIPSLRHYLLVSQWEVRVEHFARQDDGSWRYSARGVGDVILLDRPDLAIAVDDVYRGVTLSEAPVEPPQLPRTGV